jgi:hypothetical protein
MKQNSTKKRRTRLTHLTWLGLLMGAAFLFATCYEWTTIDQPTYANSDSSFDVHMVLKPTSTSDFAYDLKDVGSYGVLLPVGWGIENDSFYYSIKGTTQNDPAPYEYEGYVVFDEGITEMFVDSVGADEGYVWWGGLSDTAQVDNLDSIIIDLTVVTDAQTGEFELQYAIGTLDGDDTYPARNISPKVPITIGPVNVKKYMKEQVSIYPNPATDLLSVDVGELEAGNLSLYNMVGQLQLKKAIDSRVNTLDVSIFPAGTYFIKVSTDEGSISKKVLLR